MHGSDIDLSPESENTRQVRTNNRNGGRVVGASSFKVKPGEVRSGIEEHSSGGMADGVRQQRGGVARRRWLVLTGCVEPDDGVVVDHTAGLVFGDLDEPGTDL